MNTMKNLVQLIGNLGNDPEVKETAQGRKMARLSVATNESYTNKSGDRITDTQWHTVVAWGNQAEQAAQMLRKGAKVALQGKLVHRSYEGKDGQKRYITEVVMSEFQVVPKSEPDTVSAD
ncbi:MAG: single-stranded DNA-binding protein [Flavobacteriales bacterium]|jgi:single-strand DNA-binding protein|nr:single-stranded DNA-binding protein [Flavobacteriales bacterium]MBK6753727.1 single-stranded DNA-binding protein [Flavobacteriales bacterium]MBK7085487.1 single-stranded DNA-binding protein [Flavobacteriales bacterium]MBK7268211.1 single-stranded DNA-binding protein [Flavobacteriales bacterium]MBK7751134.1 single-stranded DNA-binding protein [Flavobacteriales bacterium]